MKKSTLLQLTFLLFTFSFLSQSHAQNALGCDGRRYLLDIATDTAMTPNVLYGNNKVGFTYQNLYMDIIMPKGDTLSRRPVIIFAFGGGFVSGERKDMRDFCAYYAKKGYVCATIDYRLHNLLGGFPDSVQVTRTIVQATQDMKAAIRFLRQGAANGNPYRIDVNNVIVGGVSAGAITAMLTAVMDSTDNIPTWIRTLVAQEGGFEGNSGFAGSLSYSSSVKGVINMSGAVYRKEWIDAQDPPFVSYHGTADNIVAYGYGINVYGFYGDGSRTCADRALQLGIPTTLVSVQGGGHTDIYPGGANASLFPTFTAKATEFVKRLICGEKPLASQDVDFQQVKVFPNPSNDAVTVEIGENTEGSHFDLSIFDALGRQVFSLKNQDATQVSIRKKDVGGTGIYVVRLQFSEASKAVVRKIIFEN